LLIPCCRVFLGQSTFSWLIEKSPVVTEPKDFSPFTKVYHWISYWNQPVKFTSSHSIYLWSFFNIVAIVYALVFQVVFLFEVSSLIFMHILFPHFCYMYCLLHPSCFNRSNNIRQRVWIWNFLFCNFLYFCTCMWLLYWEQY